MEENARQVLKDLVRDYGIGILEDPDRLSQFLEDRCPSRSAENFRLTFALRYLIKSGWAPHMGISERDSLQWIEKLCNNLGFTEGNAKEALETLTSVLPEHDDAKRPDDADTVIAKAGNLRRISGGISNKPRTMWIRKKSLYNGLILIAAFLSIAVLFFQIGGQRNPVGDEFRIVFFAPLTGADASMGHNQLRAAQLAVELINKQGGVRGYKLKIVGYDVPQNPAKAEESVRLAMKDKSILVMMTGMSGQVLDVIASIADEISVPLVITSPEIMYGALMAGSRPRLYSFNIANDTHARAKTLVYFAAQGLSKKKFGLFYDPDDKPSSAVHESALRWIKVFGGTVAADLTYSRKGGFDYSSAMKAIKESGADILLLPGRIENRGRVVRQAREVGFSSVILAESYNDLVSDEAGMSLTGSWWLNEVSALDPQVRSVLKEYRTLYNENCPPSDIEAAILAYDGVGWIANALYQAPGYRGEAIRHALLATRNFAMVHATLTIDPSTHGPLNKAMAVIYCASDKGIFQKRIRAGKTDI